MSAPDDRHITDERGRPRCGLPLRKARHTTIFPFAITCEKCADAHAKAKAPYRFRFGDYRPLICDADYRAGLMARHRARG